MCICSVNAGLIYRNLAGGGAGCLGPNSACRLLHGSAQHLISETHDTHKTSPNFVFVHAAPRLRVCWLNALLGLPCHLCLLCRERTFLCCSFLHDFHLHTNMSTAVFILISNISIIAFKRLNFCGLPPPLPGAVEDAPMVYGATSPYSCSYIDCRMASFTSQLLISSTFTIFACNFFFFWGGGH